MKEPTEKFILKLQKMMIGFCVLATLFSVSSTAFATGIKQKAIGTTGSVLAGLGLGMAIGGYLSNPCRKRERN